MIGIQLIMVLNSGPCLPEFDFLLPLVLLTALIGCEGQTSEKVA